MQSSRVLPIPPARRDIAPTLIQVLTATLLSILLLTAGCATRTTPGFDIVGADAQHGDRPFILSRNNRLSNVSLAEVVQQDVRGVFANPAYVGDSWFLVFELVLHTDERKAAETRFNTLMALELEADGQRFVIQPSDSGFLAHGLIKPTVPFHDKVARVELKRANRRSAAFQLTREKLQTIAGARQLKVSLVGSSLTLHFSPENMSGSFQQNLQMFIEAATRRVASAA